MKYIDSTPIGGQPVSFTDFQFTFESYFNIAQASFKHLSSNYAWNLTDFDIDVSTDGLTTTVGEGLVWFAGELLNVESHQVQGTTGQVPEWYVVVSYDSRGLKTFKDPDVGDINTYIVRSLKVRYVTSAVFPITITRNYLQSKTDWITPDVADGWGTSSGVSGQIPIKYRKNQLGYLELTGMIYKDSVSNVGFTLPEDYRPNNEVCIRPPSYIAPGTLLPGTQDNILIIRSNGEVYCPIDTAALNLNHIIILDN